jgi:hypothetical protein
MSRKIFKFPDPSIDPVDVYLALLDAGAEFEDPRLAQFRALLSDGRTARLVAQLRADKRTTKRADTLETQMRIRRTKR